ncbi:MAG: translation elongation factor Ts [Treponema sp.]|nr:translation elongation factor Ts [Treponema sp.]
MAEINAALVKELREKTGAGMMECKNALVETAGDLAAAEKLLKEKGLAALAKRSDRATNAGRVFIGRNAAGSAVTLVEITCETDFVSRNPDFIAMGEELAGKALESGADASDPGLNGMVAELATKIRENMALKRLVTVKAGSGECLASYLHGEGEIGVAVRCAVDKPADEGTKAFVHSLALHVAAFNPLAPDRSKIDAGYLAEQREIFAKQMEQDEKLAGKPENVLKGILEGKVNKHLAEICLLDQGYVKDEKRTVAQALADESKRSGAKLGIVEYVYFKVGT